MNLQPHVDETRRPAALLALVLLATVVPALADDCRDNATPRAPVAGVFTGEIAPGGPVYRLPSVSVVADRKTELAKAEREEQRARERQVRWNALPRAA
jgi:hypothetical protein